MSFTSCKAYDGSMVVVKQKDIYGRDPYNSADALALGKALVRSFNGPLGEIAYRSQKRWDFLPGMSAAEKIKHYVGM